MTEKKWRKRTLGGRELAPETLMMGFGYDPMLSEGRSVSRIRTT